MMGPPPPAPEDGGARTHDGFFLRLGLNFGPLIMKEKVEVGSVTGLEADYSGLHTGFDLLIGGSPAKGLAIGGALLVNQTKDPHFKAGSLEGDASGSLYFVGIGLFGDYYPDPHGGLHIQGMVGFSSVDFVNSSGQSGSSSPSGAMFGLGVGYDFWVADEWSIGPFGRVLYSSMSDEQGGATDKVSYLYPSIGLAFTLH
jgi:outer membrane autotransporter protein